jgi:hypothetical protein
MHLSHRFISLKNRCFAGRQVRTVGGVVQVLLTEGGNMLDRCWCRVGSRHHPTHSYARLGTAGNIAAPFASTWGQDHTYPLDGYAWLPGTHYSVVLPLTQHCAGTACTMKVVRPTSNEDGRLWTQNTVTPHQFYAVPRNKMGKLIFRLSYVKNRWTNTNIVNRI